jgi:hypothetical protein
MKTVTYRDLFDAIEKNGLEQAVGSWFRTEDTDVNDDDLWLPKKSEIKAACAVGQAALNLGVELHFLRENNLSGDRNLIGTIEHWNDDEELTLQQIADKGRAEYAEYLDQPFGTFPEWVE